MINTYEVLTLLFSFGLFLIALIELIVKLRSNDDNKDDKNINQRNKR